MLFEKALIYFLTIFITILIPTYWYYYGIRNFLWLSDIGLFLTIIALWLKSNLLMSMAAVGVLLLELFWCLDFFAKLIFNINISGLSDYMFDKKYPLLLRAISLFHITSPLIWIFYLAQYGYDTNAIYYFTILYWIALILTYRFTNPEENISWVFAPQANKWNIKPITWVIILFIFLPLLVFLPTHYILKILFKN